MGLRETKAARTRTQIIDTAIPLFLDKGFEATTMEEIAERAEVGTTTLYRYFPSKELIPLDPFTKVDLVANAVRDRPADEPIEAALGAAILSALETVAAEEPHINEMRAVIDAAPGPRARLWDFIRQERDLLEQVIAERLGEDIASMRVRMTARIALLVIELAADAWRSGSTSQTLPEVVDGVLAEIDARGVVLPRLDGAQPRARTA